MPARPLLLVMAGPTASGKTAASIELARHFDAPILSADSRQCYREMNIGVARPSPDELAAAPHYFIASHSIYEPVNAVSYADYALDLLDKLFARSPVVICVGGTGLYLKALLEGLDAIPAVPEAIRAEIVRNYESAGMDWLVNALHQEDPLFAVAGEMQNPHRMMRALEVMRATGRSIRSFHSQSTVARKFDALKFSLDPDRSWLYERINHRVDIMMQEGLLEEVKSLYPDKHLAALQTVGYQELFDYLDGRISLEQAITDIKTHTRNYAKRQLTWFRKQGYTAIDPLQENIIQVVSRAVE